MSQLGTGLAATALPRTLATRLGLVDIGGNGALWWFAELDTIFFDIVLLMVFGAIVYNFRSASYRNSVFWLVVVVSVLVGGALAYTVTNFGTLFRLRMMFSTLVALIPLTLMTAGPDAEVRPAEVPGSEV